ncbi:MAG: hypothetical protein J0H48_12540 [Nitrosospira multiformis]|nr:hypothetical protein [Nitrosospira multiformis]
MSLVQSNWGWTATATSVSHFYRWGGVRGRNAVLQMEIDHNDCCNTFVRDALKALREAARPLANMDDTMGA